jgi:hypothetical protein
MKHHGISLAALAALTACQVDESVGDVPGVLFGVAASTNTTNEATQESAFISVELKSEREFDLDRIYRQWDNAVPGTRELWTIQMGRTPIVSFKTTAEAPWSAIASGDHDAKLAAIAAGYLALRVPVFCIFDQSPENSGGELGTPSQYAEAYRHVITTFRIAGVTNVRWIFNLKSPTFADDADLYYPGDDVIDWIGTSAYNFGVGNPGGRWFSFAALIEDFISWATPHGKPLIITEWNSREDPDDPDAKARWIEEAAAKVQATPQIRAMSAFWSVVDGTGFDSSASALDAFRAFAKAPYTNLRQARRDELLLMISSTSPRSVARQ